MATYYSEITPEQTDLIEHSPLFFVATAAPDGQPVTEGVGPINMSPKGGSTLAILGPSRVAYLDFAGSGNETALHIAAGSPITVMFCSFDQDAAIVRLFGQARIGPAGESELASRLLDGNEFSGLSRPRQVVEVDGDCTSTSCGYGVPLMEFVRARTKADRARRFKP